MSQRTLRFPFPLVAAPLLFLATFAGRGGCGPGDVNLGSDDGGTITTPDGGGSADAGVIARTCTSASDCSAGEECRGPAGCDVAWTCQPELGRACSQLATALCGCDGVTFDASPDCPPHPYAHLGPCDGGSADAGTGSADAGVRTCASSSECAAGEVCLGGAGCDTPWTCQASPATTCSQEAAAFCGCDGVTFADSRNCPSHAYAHAGPCDGGSADAGVGSSDAGVGSTDAGVIVGCTSNADCNVGQECLGAPGCGTPWTCQPQLGRPCATDAAQFCDCTGQTLWLNATCPDHPYLHTGACP